MYIKDTQESKPPVYMKLERVGVKDVKKTIIRKRGEQYNILHATISAFIDLMPTKKGIHMSRNLEVINEIIEKTIGPEVEDTELLCIAIAKEILQRQKATRAEVEIVADYALPRETPALKVPTQENYEILSRAVAWRTDDGIKVRRSIGMAVEGMTVCPCSSEAIRDYVTEKFDLDKELIEELPLASHNQRGKATLIVETDEDYRVEADDLVTIIEDAMSSPLYEVLKRTDELQVVLDAHKKPRFVEDVLRLMLKGIAEKYPTLPDNAYIIARQENFESIHRHNAFGEKTGFFSEIKNELNENENQYKNCG
ncbi:MAG: GTP cyclohydrolase MptA [Candidatus Hydrothermarchaeales archaeon]